MSHKHKFSSAISVNASDEIVRLLFKSKKYAGRTKSSPKKKVSLVKGGSTGRNAVSQYFLREKS
jgi:hypothetical protein